MRMRPAANIQNQQRKTECHHHTNQGSQKNECRNLQNDTQLDGLKTVCHDGSSGKTSDKRVRRRGRNPLPPSKQIPGNGCNHTGQNNRQSNVRLHHRFRYGVGNAETADDTLGDKKGHKIEESRPYHRLKRCKHFGRHNGGNRIGRIMKTVDIIEYQSQHNDNH